MIKEVVLDDVCQFENGDRGKNYPSNSAFVNEGIPFINAGNLANNRIKKSGLNYITEKRYDLLRSGKIEQNDILYCLRGSLGKLAINNEGIRGAIASSLVILRAKKELNVQYLYHYLNSPRVKRLVIKSNNGSTQPNLSATNLKKFPIPLPVYNTQKKIAAILETADIYKGQTKALINKHEELAQSIFSNMFGDPVSNPKKWKVNRLKDLTTKIGSGNTPKGGSKVYVSEGITFFRSQNVWKNRIELDDVAFIDQATHDKMTRSSLKHKDILMTKTGRVNTENSSLGRAAMYLGEDDKANVNGHVYLIRPKEDVINEFVLFILTTIQYRDYIRRVCVGGIDKRQLNKEHIENFPIIYPPIESQKRFVKILKEIESQKALAEQSLKKSEDLFNSLLQKAFNGELVK